MKILDLAACNQSQSINGAWVSCAAAWLSAWGSAVEIAFFDINEMRNADLFDRPGKGLWRATNGQSSL